MNRLILVGNGFDLAHGLETSYKDFIDDFWKEQILDIKKNISSSGDYNNKFIKIYRNYSSLHHINNYKDLAKDFNIESGIGISNFIFKNNFLKIISGKNSLQNWVDIENEYYNELNKVSDTGYSVDELNKDFEEVKNLLIDYLVKIEKTKSINDKICNKIYSYFKLIDFSLEAINEKIEYEYEYEKRKKDIEAIESRNISINDIEDIDEKNILSRLIGGDKKSAIRDILENLNGNHIKKFKMNPEEILFLNFNYTDTILNYITNNKCNRKNMLSNFNNIHGNLVEIKYNPIIFGFGDDVDKKYQEFEDLNDNRYLKNFKSIAYSQTDNYKRLLEFIESDNFQVFIFGHSCGISDRTMLNTIFEHDNCKSIKPFYHKREDGTDNYTEIVQNISRNFNDKKKYRDRVVNKTYCEPLT